MGDRLAVIQSEESVKELKLVEKELRKTIKLFESLLEKSNELNSLFAKGTPKEYLEGMGKLQELMTRIAKAEKDLIDISAKYEVINTRVSKVTENKRKALSEYDRELEKTIKLQGEEYKAVARQKVINAELTKEKRQQAQAEVQAQQRLANSISLYNKVELKIKALTVRYNELATKKALGLKLNDSEEKSLNNLSAKIQKYDQVLKAVDTTVGKNQRNVGNYKSGFNELGNSVNQLSREMPAFANSVQTGFMALSNNIPIFFDAIGNIRKQNAALRAEGKPTVSTFKQIAGSILSWGTALSIGVTLLTVYGADLYKWARALIVGKEALDQLSMSQQSFTDALENGDYAKTVQTVREMADYVKLAKDGFLDKERVLKEYNEGLGKVLGTASSFNEVEQLLIAKTPAYLEAMRYRSAAQVALQKASEARAKADFVNYQKDDEFFNVNSKITNFLGGLLPVTKKRRKEMRAQAQLQRIETKKEQEELANTWDKVFDEAELKAAEAAKKGKLNVNNLFLGADKDKNKDKDKKKKDGLSNDQKDYLDSLIAIRDTDLAIAKEKQVQGEINEKQYWEKRIQIVKTYRQKVADYLNGANGREKRIEASVRRRGIEEIANANKEIFDYEKEQLESRYKMRQEVIERKLNEINNNEYDFEIEKIQQRNSLYNEQIADTAKFYDDLLKSAVKYSQEYIAIEAKRDDEIGKFQDKQNNNNANSPKAMQQYVDYWRELADLQYKAVDYEDQRRIIANSRLNADQKGWALQFLSFKQNREQLEIERERLKLDVAILEAKKRSVEEEKKLAILKNALSKNTNSDAQNDESERLANIQKFKEDYGAVINQVKSGLDDFGLSNLSSQFDKTLEEIVGKTFDWKDAMVLAASAVADALTMISDRQKERTIANLDEQLRVSQENTDLEIGFITSRLEMLNAIQDKTAEQITERNALEDEARAVRERQQQREKLIATQKAKAEQKAQAQQALINGALAATMTLAQLGIPLGIIPAAIALGFGVAQSAIIMSKNPVPQYYVGTDNARGGLAWTQERGAEIITDKNDNIKSYGNNRGAQLTMLNPGDKVYTAGETQSIIKDFPKPNWSKIATDSTVIPIVNIPKEKIDYDLFADKVGGRFDAVMKKYDKVNIYEENGVVYKQVGSKIPVAISNVSPPQNERPNKDYRNFRD